MREVSLALLTVFCSPGTQPATAPATPTATSNSIGMKLVYIAAGRFRMGSPREEAGRDKDEGPTRPVTLTRAFYMGTHEVTQAQYEAVMGTNPSWFAKGGDYPVDRVEWFDAVQFCKKLSAREGRVYRLPTEAEWEYACRAGTTTPFAFGATLTTGQANYDGNYPYANAPAGVYRQAPLPVGRLAPNAWGLYDMHGNVWEWCADWYGKQTCRDAGEQDPIGPKHGSARVMRGGAWNRFARGCRSADRGHSWPGNRLITLGFRVVREFPAPTLKADR